ncbi:MAG TPA: hypothetical protein VLF90_01465 [Patescibacteria group bacterium]|nr:hypothetical protein [Patescibacteria group bacterium]
MKQKQLQKLFEKQMNRKEFLLHIGAGILAIMGVSGLIKNLINYSPNPHRQLSAGYGSSSYGGGSRKH